jgi:hypothetical protein
VPRQTSDRLPCLAVLKCRGHPNVTLTHETTLEFEETDILTPRGDCIACVSCSGGEGVRECAKLSGLALVYLVAVNPWEEPHSFNIYGFSPESRPLRLIVRKSEYKAESIIVKSSAAAADVPRGLAETLKSPFTRCFTLYAVLPVELASVKTAKDAPHGDGA